MIKVYGTARSHFTRKVRILLDLYEIHYELIDVGNVAEGDIEKFRNNPLMRVPVLENGSDWVIDSENICKYIVETFDKKDRYQVIPKNTFDSNVRAIVNGIMSEEVTLILAKRTGVPIEQYDFFTSSKEAISQSLTWLESKGHIFNFKSPRFQEFHIVCAWEHIDHFNLVPLNYPNLNTIVKTVGAIDVIRRSSPYQLKP